MHHLQKQHKETTVQFSGISPNLAMTSLCFLQEVRRVVRLYDISNTEVMNVI